MLCLLPYVLFFLRTYILSIGRRLKDELVLAVLVMGALEVSGHFQSNFCVCPKVRVLCHVCPLGD